jgi:hypothetical protein
MIGRQHCPFREDDWAMILLDYSKDASGLRAIVAQSVAQGMSVTPEDCTLHPRSLSEAPESTMGSAYPHSCQTVVTRLYPLRNTMKCVSVRWTVVHQELLYAMQVLPATHCLAEMATS